MRASCRARVRFQQGILRLDTFGHAALLQKGFYSPNCEESSAIRFGNVGTATTSINDERTFMHSREDIRLTNMAACAG